MSFDIFLGCFHGGEVSDFPSSVIEKAFGPFTITKEPTCRVLAYPDGGHSELYVDDTPAVSDFMVARPCRSPEFLQGLFDVLRETTSILYWGQGCVIADAAVIPHLPPDMLESLGEPTFAAKPDDIDAAINKSLEGL